MQSVPTARMLVVLTFRPEFSLPWGDRRYVTQLTLSRLDRGPSAEIATWAARGMRLPQALLEQVLSRTDGNPLFIEELSKMVLESGVLREANGALELVGPLPPLAIPTTLHDSLMARLDRLEGVKAVAQMGATLGRAFSYELLQAVSPLEEPALRHGLEQLVEAEFLYQSGLPPASRYVFKHALIQEAAYQAVLRSTRQDYHGRVAEVIAQRFPDVAERQPELIAHHYTEAGLGAAAIPYWQSAGQRALQRAANVEAIAHLERGLELLRRSAAQRVGRPSGARAADRPRARLYGDQGLGLARGGADLSTRTRPERIARRLSGDLRLAVGTVDQLLLARQAPARRSRQESSCCS